MTGSNIAYIEVRPAAGGNEAKIWASDLLRMYMRWAAKTGLSVTQLDEQTAMVRGDDVFGLLKAESGVHRVQRIPSTEKRGRIHTSTATVAVLPQVEETEVQINPGVLDISFFRSGGAGGQNVNKVNTAVRILHKPTGLAVAASTQRSQEQNRASAMAVLRSKLWEREQEKKQDQIAALRSAIGAGDRAEKIRTYNYPQSRVTDHRIGKSWGNLEAVVDGDLGKILIALGNRTG